VFEHRCVPRSRASGFCLRTLLRGISIPRKENRQRSNAVPRLVFSRAGGLSWTVAQPDSQGRLMVLFPYLSEPSRRGLLTGWQDSGDSEIRQITCRPSCSASLLLLYLSENGRDYLGRLERWRPAGVLNVAFPLFSDHGRRSRCPRCAEHRRAAGAPTVLSSSPLFHILRARSLLGLDFIFRRPLKPRPRARRQNFRPIYASSSSAGPIAVHRSISIPRTGQNAGIPVDRCLTRKCLTKGGGGL
jgi:hypothetical protein